MAAITPSDEAAAAAGCINPSCVEVKKKYLELEERRKALREAMKVVKLLNTKLEQTTADNAKLKKCYDEERRRADVEKEAKEKESSIRQKLEIEINNLKKEMASYQQTAGGSASSNDDGLKVLEARILERESEIKRIEQLMEKEKQRADCEKMKAKADREKAAEAQKLLTIEKSKAEEDRRRAESERKRAGEENAKLLEVRVLERESELKRVTQLLEKEKRRCESEKKKTQVEKEKSAKAQKLLMMEKSKVEDERVRAESERKKADACRISLESLRSELTTVREKLIVEKSKADDAIQKVEAEKQKAHTEKIRADTEKMEAEDQRKLLEVEREKALEEKTHAECLSQQLKDEKQMREELLKKIKEGTTAQIGLNCSSLEKRSCRSATDGDEAIVVHILKEKLKMEKKRVKYAKRLRQLEKAEKGFICQQFSMLKKEFAQLSGRLNMIDNCLSYGTEGKEGLTKIVESPDSTGFNLHNKLLDCNCNSQSDHGPIRSSKAPLNCPNSTKECGALHISGGSCTRPTPGISSELESPIRDSIRNKPQNSAVCSTTTTFSDRTFMGSQERDGPFITTEAKLTGSSSDQRLAVSKIAGENGNGTQPVGNSVDRGLDQQNTKNIHLSAFAHDKKEVNERLSGCPTKKRRIQQTTDCVTKLFSVDDQLHSNMNVNIFAPKDIVSVSGGLPRAVLSHNCEIPNFGKRVLLNEKDDGMCNLSYEHRRKIATDEHQNQHQTEIFQVEGKPNNSTVENVDVNNKESSNAVSRDPDTLICIQDMVCVDYLKLLELDNKDDERRYRIAMQRPLSPTLPEINFPESEKDCLPSFSSFDIVDLEIKSNMLKLKTSNSKELFLVNNKDFTHSYEKPNSSGGNTADNESNQEETGEYFSIENIRLNVEQICDVIGSNSFMNCDDLAHSVCDLKGPLGQTKPLAKCLLDPNNIPNSNSRNDSAYANKNRCLPGFPNCTAGSHQSSEYGPTKSCNMEINSCSVAMGPEPTCGIKQVQSSGLVKCHNGVEGKKADETIVTKPLNHDLRDTGSRKLIDARNTVFAAGQTQTDFPMVVDSIAVAEASKESSLPAMKILENPQKSDKSFECIPKYCILFSGANDQNSISRIIRARNNLAHQDSLSGVECLGEVFHALKFMTDLLPEEKASVFFSLLLCNISVRISASSQYITNGDILCCLESVAVNVNKVIFDREIKWLFEEILHEDILLNLIEDFLVSGKVLSYDDIQSGSSSSICCLEGENICFLYEAATLDQLITAGAVLACICNAIGYVDFLLEASYKILRTCQSNVSFVLKVLHSFASVTGNKFFTTKSYNFVVPAIRSLVSLLEKGHDPLSDVYTTHSTCHRSPTFYPCEQCPFYANAVSVDQYASSLLDMLQDYASGIRRSNTSTSIVSSACKALACIERDEESLHSKVEVHDLNMHCDESCMLSKYNATATSQSNSILGMTFCHFTDVVSLLELVCCYMSWEWRHTNIISRLLKILEMCVSEEISADLLVLIGQLARFGIDAGGYQQSGIAELRCTLSRILETLITKKGSFIVQLASVGALINLLPLTLMEAVDDYGEHSLDASQSIHAEVIIKWFSQLSSELKSLSLSLFCHSDEHKI